LKAFGLALNLSANPKLKNIAQWGNSSTKLAFFAAAQEDNIAF
jgi:hypothetical protein